MGDVNESLYMPHRPTERRDEWQGPIWNDCGGCNSVRRDVERGEGRRRCLWCERDAMERLRNLAHNLAIAAGYCASFELGRDYQHCIENAMSRHDEAVARQDEWHPGCGRSAP